MDLKHSSFTWLALSFIGGILFADLYPSSMELHGLFFLFYVVAYILLHLQRGELHSFFSKLRMMLPILIFIEAGQLCMLFSSPATDTYALEKRFLPGNRLIVEIEDISALKGKYRKTEGKVYSLINYKDTLEVRGRILLFIEDDQQVFKRKDVCVINTEITRITGNGNPGGFNTVDYWRHKGISYMGFVGEDQIQKTGRANWKMMDPFITARDFFSAILEQYNTGQESAVAKGLILGDRSSIENEVTQKFGNTGAMHILAVSGLHVAILVQILAYLLALFPRFFGKKQALMTALLVVWIYSALTGFSPSVARSALMFTILSGSTLLGKNYNALNCLSLSAFLLLVWNPHYLFDIGFQLSYLAMLGIFMFNGFLSKQYQSRNTIVRNAWEGSMVGIAAQVMTLPLTLYYFHQFPNYFILTNLGLMVFSFLVLAAGILLFSIHWIPFLAKMVAFLLQFIVFCMLWIIDFIDKIPYSVSMGFVLSVSDVLFLFFVVVAFYFVLQKKRMKFLHPLLAISLIWTVFLVKDRWERLNTEQLCFFKDSQLVFVVKEKGQLFCFYADRNKNLKKAKYLAEAYQRLYPGTVNYIEISGRREINIQTGKKTIRIVRKKGAYELAINSASYTLITSSGQEQDLTAENRIYAPWISSAEGEGHQLSKGALVIGL